MLDRNRRIKPRPERFQATTKQFDVIFTAEERIYDAVVESKYLIHQLYIMSWIQSVFLLISLLSIIPPFCPIGVSCVGLESRGSTTFTPVHVLNIDIKDNHEEATLGAFLVLELCEMVSTMGYQSWLYVCIFIARYEDLLYMTLQTCVIIELKRVLTADEACGWLRGWYGRNHPWVWGKEEQNFAA